MFGWWLQRPAKQQEVEKELRYHLDMLARDEAEQREPWLAESFARRKLGNRTLLLEDIRAVWIPAWVENLVQDLRYARRVLVKNAGFSMAAVLALALGIGGNTAMFSLIRAVILHPLPYPNPDSLVSISEVSGKAETYSPAWLDFQDWQKQATTIDSMAAVRESLFILSGVNEPERLSGADVSANFFRTLGIQPLLGRPLMPEDDRKGAAPVVVISYPLWQQKFHGDRAICGKPVTLSGVIYTVAGVLPPTFRYIHKLDILAPIGLATQDLGSRGDHPRLGVIARLKPRTSRSAAELELNLIASRLAQQYPASNRNEHVKLQPLAKSFTGSLNRSLLLLFGAVIFVLLIACANVANLFLARSGTRQNEMAVRVALGAHRSRLIRQVLTECLLLAIIGFLCGLLLAHWGITILVTLLPNDVQQLTTVTLDPQVLVFSLGLATATAFLFGIAPAISMSAVDPQLGLQSRGRTIAGNRRGTRLLCILVNSEVALALILMIGAGLMLRSLQRLNEIGMGFRTDHILTVPLNPSLTQYPRAEQILSFYARLKDVLLRTPGIRSVGYVECLPLKNDSCWSSPVVIQNGSQANASRPNAVAFNVADGGYFSTLGIPLRAGRLFSHADTPAAQPVALVNESLVRQFWPHESPLGKQIMERGTKTPRLLTIIGVIDNIKHRSLENDIPEVYYSATQTATGLTLVIRTIRDPRSLAGTLTRILHEMDPTMPVHDVHTMDDLLEEATTSRRLSRTVLSLFAALAVLLAGIGIYGVTAYYVTQRKKEIGICIALGAAPSDVFKRVAKDSLVLTIPGIVGGVLIAAAMTRLMKALLYGVSPNDFLTFALIPGFLLLVASVAIYLPARQAAKVDPISVLRVA
jgi:putative ABC transport system permease protein